VDFDDTPDEYAFRVEVRAWLEANVPDELRIPEGAGRAVDRFTDEYVAACRSWQRTLYAGGWAGIGWPVAYGGRGATPMQSAIFAQEQGRFGVPVGPFMVSLGMVGPTLIVHGTPEQQRRHLQATLSGQRTWCQLFSEPDAGSDLASLRTRAELDGDEWVIDGQKVWTSYGQYADWGILLARTDPTTMRHQGISFFLVDMRSPGIEVRPLRQITGSAHFNEIFFTGLRIPTANLVGEVNSGWNVARTTLGNERAMIGGGPSHQSVPGALADLARRTGRAGDPVMRQELMRVETNARLLTYLSYRLQTALSRGEQPGPEGSVMKLLLSRQAQLVGDVALELQGAAGGLYGDDAPDDGGWQEMLCDQYGIRIGGGTDEVQRNIVAERILGLPRDPRPPSTVTAA